MRRTKTTLATAIIFLCSLTFAACHKGGSEAKQVTPEEAKKNAELEKTQPHLAPTVVGSVERINLAVSGSMSAYREHKWSDVTAYLNGARQEVDKALAEIPEKKKNNAIREPLEEMKDALDRATQSANSRSQQIESQLTELQTRAMALKVLVQPPQQPAQPQQ
ncbi:MAG TPA: hypothetical protein VJZ91_13715 [Blastocatellia bacterium]|nr:hypothetical protein [Blastocatellia bacterium]